MVKYPEVKIKLVGEDGNAFAILGRVHTAMIRAKMPKSAWEEYKAAATSGDYNNLLAVTMETVSCDEDEGDEE